MQINISLQDITNAVVALVAIASLVLSVIAYRSSRKDKQPDIRARIYNGLPVYGNHLGEAMLILEVANAGERVVRITGADVVIKGRHTYYPNGIPGTHRLPFDLKQGESASFWLDLREFAVVMYEEGFGGHPKVRACFKDAVGNEYLSKQFTINAESWAKSASRRNQKTAG